MQVYRNLSEVRLNSRSILTIGTYDGIHLGHQRIVTRLMKSARAHQVPGVLVTLHPHPRTVLVPDRPAALLTTPEEKIDVLAKLGLDILVILPFSKEFAQTSAREFIQILVDIFRPLEIWEGYNFGWGKNREGNIDLLQELGQAHNFKLSIIGPQEMASEVVSSTRIRGLLRAGEVREAASLLGRYPSLRGSVVPGAGRGRIIGFPTANLAVSPDRLLPADGVYAAFVWIDEQRYPGVANIGVRPSFNETERTVEVHIFNFDRNIYDKPIQVDFVAHLRPEQKFESIEALNAQIRQDAVQARQLLGEEPSPEQKIERAL
ncbi:MAG: bifunctional riboflavin kinase/FAD synthetase [Anaerolineae bacterium]